MSAAKTSDMTLARLRSSVARDRYSDYLPLVAWGEQEEAFLCIDDGWGYGWELIPSAYMFGHVHAALLGLLNIHFPEGTVLQLHSFADPLIAPALDAYQDLKVRDDPLIQASARHTADYLHAGRHGLRALHGIPLRNFRTFLSIKASKPLDEDLRRQVEEQLAKLGIRRMAAEETVSLYRRIFNGVYADAPGVFTAKPVDGGAAPPVRRQIIDAGPDLSFEGPELFLGNHVARCLTPKSPARRITAERANRLTGGMRGSSEDSDQIGGPFLLTLNVLFDHSQFEIHKRAQILSAQKAAGSFAVEVGKQIEEIGWVLDEAGTSKFVRVIPTLWVFGRDRAHAREMAARAKRLWESEPLPFMMQEESYLNPVLLPMSLPFGLYPDRKTLRLLERDFRMPVKSAVLMAPIQTDFRGGGRPALLYVGRKGQLVTLDLFDPRINNYNFVVSAESGAGKSFLLNNLCLQYYAQNALIRIIDIGGSYRKLCTLCSGRYIDVGEEHLVLNPFDLGLALDGDDRQSAISMAVAIVAEMANAATRKGVTTSEWNLLKSAVQWTIDEGHAEEGIDAVRAWLGSYPQFAASDFDRVDHLIPVARELAFNLRDFARLGVYGHYFNGPSTFDIAHDEFVVLELERLKNMPNLFNVIVMVVVNALTQELYLSPRDRPRFVLCDEAAQFMTRTEGQDLSRLAEAFAQGYRRARKYQGSFGIVLQSMNDLMLFGGTGQVILEHALVETIDDNTTDPDSKIVFGAGGHAFDLFFNAVTPQGPMTDIFLDQTIKDYARQCYPVARVSPAYDVDDDKLFRTTTDLASAFGAMAGPATYSTVYSSADKAGTTMSCSDAWANIQSRLSDPTTFNSYQNQVCARSSFDGTDANQLARCKGQLGEIGQMMMGNALGTQGLMTDILLGNTVGDVLFEDSPATAARVMANRATITSGLATLSVANEWMPTIRATVFGIMLFMVPIALLFILTPINLRVASFALGLFVFVALWGVIDAGIYQLTLGRAMSALAEMRANGVAANAWLMAPSAAQKALAIFGSFRTAAAGLAGAFVFTVFRFSGNVFSAVTGGALADLRGASGAAAPLATSEGRASALEAQASAFATSARKSAVSTFGDFGERSSFAANRGFGEAGGILGGQTPAAPGIPAFGMGGIDAARELGGLAPALRGGDLSDPGTQRAVQANAATAAFQQFAQGDALRSLGQTYFGQGQAGERAFASFAQNMVQWKAFGDERAYAMMMDGATRHFQRDGYSADDAKLKATGVIADAAADPLFGKLIANSFEQEQVLRNEITGAQTEVGAMEGRRDFAGNHVAATERSNVATEQASRTGTNAGQRTASAMLGLSVQETARRIAFINALSGEARSSAITQLAHATGRNEAQVEHALETYNTANQVGTADGATREAAREGTSVYGRTREAAGYDFAERSGKLDAQREVGPDGVRGNAMIGEQRRQSENAGFADAAAADGVSVREAAHLDSFIRTLGATAGNQVDMADGGPDGIADRGRNARTTQIVDQERLTRMQGLLRAHGISMDRKQLVLAQNGDLSMNVTPRIAAQMRQGGLINDSQFGAIAQGGHARFSFADNDLLVSSSTGFSQSTRNDTSTKFEAGKQAGPDTIEHFLGGGAEGHTAMARWLHGGFEMDRRGNWRLKPQVADTLERDVTAIMSQTGWQRSIARSADHQTSDAQNGTSNLTGSVSRGGESHRGGASGTVSGNLGVDISDRGVASVAAQSSLDVMNYDVRSAIATAEKAAARSAQPEETFSSELIRQVLGDQGLRNRYLEQSDFGRGTTQLTAPIMSIEQSSILNSGRLKGDRDHGWGDGDPEFKERRNR